MTGCGNVSSTNTATENTVAVSDTESGKVDEKSDSTVTGMIESIEDNTITLSVMNPNGGGRPDGGAPDANGTGDKPSGVAPDNNGGGMPGGESKTITVSTTAVITDEEGNTVSLSDLGKGTMVTIELDEDGNAISITIASKENSMGAPRTKSGSTRILYDCE